MRDSRHRPDQVALNIKLQGSVIVTQDGRTSTQKVGDFGIYDSAVPFEIVNCQPVDQLVLLLPRNRLENLLGSARRYTALTMHGHMPTNILFRSFVKELLSQSAHLTPDAADRMSSICIDLAVASIAERMATDAPKSLHSTLTVQRAKAYIEQNLGNTGLNTAEISTATGVSLRHLQTLFRDHGHSIADWLWQRRLDTAAQRLSDPKLHHVSLDIVAYGCGFASQSHFSRRFRDRYDLTPSEYRQSALAALRKH